MNPLSHGLAVFFPASLAFLRNGVVIAVIANALIGASLVWDKVLLRQPETTNLVSYVFWLGAISIFGLLLAPFGFHWPKLSICLLAFATGILHLAAVWFYYAALKRGEASQTLAVMGGFSPVATALIAIPLLRHPYLSHGNLLAFALLVAGGFVMFLSEKLNLRRILPAILLASGLFGLVNVLQKVVFDNTNFVSGYVIFTFGTFAGAMLLLVGPRWRRQIFVDSEKAEPRSRFWYFVNRFVSGIGSFLIFYAIDLAHPAVVDAISGVRYAIIFLGAYGLTRLYPRWLQENFHGWALAGKSLATLLIVAGLVFLGLSGKGPNAGPAARRVAPMSSPSFISLATAARHEVCARPRPRRSAASSSASLRLLKTLKLETLKLVHSEISITPMATSDAPAQRFHPTSSPSRYLASAVSSR